MLKRYGVEQLESRQLFDAAAFDPAFGANGLASADQIAPLSESVRSLAVTASGQTYIAYSDFDGHNFLRRYTSTLQPDTTFGSGGTVVPPSISTLAIDSAGRPLVSDGNHLYRYTTAGVPDATFGTNGVASASSVSQVLTSGNLIYVTTSSGTIVRYNASGIYDSAYGARSLSGVTVSSLATDSAGDVFVAGTSGTSGTQIKVLKFKADGTPDATFGTAGIATLTPPGTALSRVHLQLAPQVVNGKIVLLFDNNVASYPTASEPPVVEVARLTTSGAPDTTFDSDGYANAFRSGSLIDGNAVAVDSSSRVLVLGDAGDYHTSVFSTVLRLTASGTNDTSFDGDGARTFNGAFFDAETAIAPAPDGTLWIGGYLGGRDAQFHVQLTQLNGSGSILKTQSFIDTGSTAEVGLRVVSGSDGDAYQIVSRTGSPPQLDHFLASGAVDTAFGNKGFLTLQPPDIAGYLSAPFLQLARQSDGKLLVAALGAASPLDIGDVYLFRININGTFDSSFGNGGLAKINYGQNDIPNAILPMPDGGVLVASSTNSDNATVNFTRLTASGAPNTSFGTGGKLTVTAFASSVINNLFVSGTKIVALGNARDDADKLYNRPFTIVLTTAGQVTYQPQWVDASAKWDYPSPFAARANGYVATFVHTDPTTYAVTYGLGLLDSNGRLIGAPTQGFSADAIETRADGRFMGVAIHGTSGTTPAGVTITMYKSDGILDTGFGTGGQQALDYPLAAGSRLSLAVPTFTPQDNVLISGTLTTTGSPQFSDVALLRLLVPAVATTHHIDSGGGASGIYSADGGYSGGSTYSTTAAIDTSAVASPASQSVYQTERFGNFTYNLAGLTAGKQYTVTLHFDELYWTATGKRVFNVTGNGAAWLTNFDIFASAGAKNKAITRSFTATADSAGKIAIVFTGVKDNAKVNAIDVVEAGTTTPVTPASTYINAGGSATGSFAADTGFSGGKTTTVTNAIDTSAITSPAPQAVYQTERYGNFTYTIANLVVGQQYTLSLDFAETYWTAAGQRVFNVAVNGQTQLSNFDVYAAAGAKFKAVRKQFTVTPDSAGKVAITFTTVKDNAKVSGIELVPVA